MKRAAARLGLLLAMGLALLMPALGGSPASASGGVTYAVQTVSAPSGESAADLGGISCPSVGNCVGVGAAGVSTFEAVADTLTGGTWTSQAIAPAGLIYPELNDVWCASLTSCVAVGDYAEPADTGQALIETLSGTTWTTTTAGLAPSGEVTSTLTSISCTAITTCVAAGDYKDAGGDTHAMFESLSAGTWTPAVSTDLATATSTQVESIQCFSGTSCLAVGLWGPNNTTSNGLLETLSGTTWTASTLATGAILKSLWCASSTSCIAAGYNAPGIGGLTETLSGTTWAPGSIPGIGDGGSANGVLAISCSTAVTSCVALGSWRPPAPNSSFPLITINTLSGGTWTPTEVPAPSGTIYPAGIDCPSITNCVGVGAAETESFGPGEAIIGSPVVTPPPPPPHGYWLVGSDGGIFTFGSANFFGSTGSLKLNRPVVGITPTADKNGYWLVASDGGIFAFGDAPFVGSIPGIGLLAAGAPGPGTHLNAPIVGMVPSASGAGYFMVASDGGVFAFGDAAFEGSCPALANGCAGAAVGVAPDASGHGYWLVTASGYVYTFGDATSFGGPGPQSSPITSIVRTPNGSGYWILDAAGSVYAYGDATYFGGLPAGAAGGSDPASAIFATSDGAGYWISTALGKVTPFGNAPADGDTSATKLNRAIIAATGF